MPIISGVRRSLSRCAPNAPRATAKNPEIEPQRKKKRSIVDHLSISLRAEAAGELDAPPTTPRRALADFCALSQTRRGEGCDGVDDEPICNARRNYFPLADGLLFFSFSRRMSSS